MTKMADDWLPKPRILHPWPSDRFAVNPKVSILGPLGSVRGRAQ
jgi:hypothetical protein